MTDHSLPIPGLPFVLIFSELILEDSPLSSTAQTRETRVDRETTDDD